MRKLAKRINWSEGAVVFVCMISSAIITSTVIALINVL
jgi:hypothetical protein